MQYARYFLSIAGVSLALVMVPGCEDDKQPAGNGGEGGEGSWTAGVGGSSSTGGGDVEPPVMMGMTAAHNEARANVEPAPAKPMPALTWSSDLAGVAQAYAEKCIWEHSMGDYGENLYATSGGGTPKDVVDSWVSEVSDYDYATNACNPGAACGHYTQVVWANTLRLGCGMANCTNGAVGNVGL
jgi:pathogenesis-related protein 1